MDTITFYSYKGGVGRTLALANVAVYLSRFDKSVCIIDFDLEAPGVPYKLSGFFPSPIETGLVDYIYEFTFTGTVPSSLQKFILKARHTPTNTGNIWLFPAGNILAAEYWKKLASIDWYGLFYKEGGEGIPFFLELKEKMRREINPDFLLIDSRTGITEMSSICTTILPDKLIFFITNNRENIEGSRQILRGIQKVKRLKNQDPIKVTLALTRIPFPQNKEEQENEQKIIREIKSFLNEEFKSLDEQLNIGDISVLHSDRSLELSESLRLSLENVIDKPLAKDYLQLFSTIIPGKLVETKIHSVLENIISRKNLFEAPDKIEKELEAVAFVYPHPQSFEKLIDFYFLRNKSSVDKLQLFLRLWTVSKKFTARMFSRFIQAFLEIELDQYYWHKSKDFFIHIAGIAEEYIKANPDAENIADILVRLADIYKRNSEYKAALEYYLKALDRIEDKSEILKKVFEIYKEQKEYKEVHSLYEKYSDTIAAHKEIKIQILEIMYLENNRGEIERLLNIEPGLIDSISEKNIELYSKIMIMLGREDELDRKLLDTLLHVIAERSEYQLVDMGRLFFKLNKFEIFKKHLPDEFPEKQLILSRITREIY